MKCEKCGLEYREELLACPRCHPYGDKGITDIIHEVTENNLSIVHFFKGAFRQHGKGAGAKIFMAGTPQSTPAEDMMIKEWEVPWLYARVFLAGMLFALLCFFTPYNALTLITIGSLIVPISILTFYWEANIPRDIPLYKIATVLLFGSAIAFATLPFLGHNSIPKGMEYLAPFTEEPAKIIATSLFIYFIKPRYIFGGMLIGAAVGAGFAAFETIGYNLGTLNSSTYGNSVFLLALRSVWAIGGHVTWAAIEGGALLYAMNKSPFSLKYFFSGKFLPYVAATFAMHFAWNFPVNNFMMLVVKNTLLCVVAVYVSFTLLNKAINQVVETVGAAKIRKSQFVQADILSKDIILTAKAGPVAGNTYPFKDTIIIGRDPSVCQVILPADTPGVSRKHCILKVQNDGVYIMDVSSKGTFLKDGTPLPNNEWKKISGDFCLGSSKIVFSIE